MDRGLREGREGQGWTCRGRFGIARSKRKMKLFGSTVLDRTIRLRRSFEPLELDHVRVPPDQMQRSFSTNYLAGSHIIAKFICTTPCAIDRPASSSRKPVRHCPIFTGQRHTQFAKTEGHPAAPRMVDTQKPPLHIFERRPLLCLEVLTYAKATFA